MVALSSYDYEAIKIITNDPYALTLVFYNVTLIRKAGEKYVGYRVLFAISDLLAKFLDENEDAVLCFYCDANTDVRRNHGNMLPQEYRSKLFSRMFELYIASHKLSSFINHRLEIEDCDNPANKQYAHFICRVEHEDAVAKLAENLMQK